MSVDPTQQEHQAGACANSAEIGNQVVSPEPELQVCGGDNYESNNSRKLNEHLSALLTLIDMPTWYTVFPADDTRIEIPCEAEAQWLN